MVGIFDSCLWSLPIYLYRKSYMYICNGLHLYWGIFQCLYREAIFIQTGIWGAYYTGLHTRLKWPCYNCLMGSFPDNSFLLSVLAPRLLYTNKKTKTKKNIGNKVVIRKFSRFQSFTLLTCTQLYSSTPSMYLSPNQTGMKPSFRGCGRTGISHP